MEHNRRMLVYDPKKIIALREALGLKSAELARKAKLSAPSLWSLEKGLTKAPKFDTLRRIAGALGVPISALMADKQPEDVDDRIAAAVTALSSPNKAALLAAAVALLESQKRK